MKCLNVKQIISIILKLLKNQNTIKLFTLKKYSNMELFLNKILPILYKSKCQIKS